MISVLGERLRFARRDIAKLTLGQVHEYEGILASHLSEMETSKKQPTAETIARLARRYKVSADYLLGIVDDPFANQDLSTDEQTTLAAIRALRGRDKLVARTLLAVLAKEEPEERRFTLDVIARILRPAQPHIIGEDPGDDVDMAASNQPD